MRKKNKITEQKIIYRYLNKLNFNKSETFNFNNDAAFLKKRKNKEIVVTNDTIVESIDFFKSDPAESVAQKIITYNLSDISSMGADPYAYTLSLSLPKKITHEWISKFVKKILYFQNKYNFFLLGGDISQSNQLIISSNFFGYVAKQNILKREFPNKGDDIWVTGYLGDSAIGLALSKKQIVLNDVQTKYFTSKFLFPKPCMIGSLICKISTSAIDISDGFYGDLSKIINSKLIGANIYSSKIPYSSNLKKLFAKNKIVTSDVLNAGDDYELIFTAPKDNRTKLKKIATKYHYRITKVGRIIGKNGIYVDDQKIMKFKNPYQHSF